FIMFFFFHKRSVFYRPFLLAFTTFVFLFSANKAFGQKLTIEKWVPTDRASGDNFGNAVAVDGNYAVVGAPNEDEDASGSNTLSNAGSVYVYYKSDGVWTFQQKLVASDRGAGDNFGASVAISGDYIVVRAYNEDEDAGGSNTLSNAGSAYVFVRSGSTWSQQKKLVASDRAAGDAFGWSVAINGDYIVVGARFEDEDASGANTISSAGSAYVFSRSGSTWTQQQKLVASIREVSTFFGQSLAMDGTS